MSIENNGDSNQLERLLVRMMQLKSAEKDVYLMMLDQLMSTDEPSAIDFLEGQVHEVNAQLDQISNQMETFATNKSEVED